MKDYRQNHYERAFENWLIDNSIKHLTIDQTKKAEFSRAKIKSFDFLLYPNDDRIIIAEIKGRKFTGTSLANLTSLESWVTVDDCLGLSRWAKKLGQKHISVFIFAYKFENIDVDFDGRGVFHFGDDRYIFFCFGLDDYCSNMKTRSPKWRTVNLSADNFRKLAIPAEQFLL